MRWSASAPAVVVVLAIAACGSTAPAATPASAPAPAPAPLVVKRSHRVCPPVAATCDASISNDTALGVVREHCWACHGAGGIANHDIRNVAELRSVPLGHMLGACEMPPEPTVLSEADRTLLMSWAACLQNP